MVPILMFVIVVAQAPGTLSAPAAFQHVISGTTALKPSESAMIGTIDRYDDTSRRLTLKAKDGTKVSFVISQDATIRMGAHTLPAEDLATNNGRRAKVRFTIANGHRTAHWVAVSSEPPRTQ